MKGIKDFLEFFSVLVFDVNYTIVLVMRDKKSTTIWYGTEQQNDVCIFYFFCLMTMSMKPCQISS